jgi:predicted flap endonuclease-1-like 5' DNA nuclease
VTSQSADTLRSRYVEQAASDLRENHRRQQELAEELGVLRQEEALLVDILALAERHENPASPSGPREPVPVEEPVAEEAPAREDVPVAAAQAAQAAQVAEQPRQAPLSDLLTGLLGTHQGPRLAKQLREELVARFPEWSPTPQVVRNTLESLVSKGLVERHNQQRSVTYALVQPVEQEAATAAADAD